MSIPFSNTHYRIPRGFANLLEGLTREVLREQPQDIPHYAARYFAELLKQREESGFDPAEWGASLEDRYYNNHSFQDLEDKTFTARTTEDVFPNAVDIQRSQDLTVQEKDEDEHKLAEDTTLPAQIEDVSDRRESVPGLDNSKDTLESQHRPLSSQLAEVEHKQEEESDTDNLLREQSATVIQAAFRGHQAREGVRKVKEESGENNRMPHQEYPASDEAATFQDKDQKVDDTGPDHTRDHEPHSAETPQVDSTQVQHHDSNTETNLLPDDAATTKDIFSGETALEEDLEAQAGQIQGLHDEKEEQKEDNLENLVIKDEAEDHDGQQTHGEEDKDDNMKGHDIQETHNEEEPREDDSDDKQEIQGKDMTQAQDHREEDKQDNMDNVAIEDDREGHDMQIHEGQKNTLIESQELEAAGGESTNEGPDTSVAQEAQSHEARTTEGQQESKNNQDNETEEQLGNEGGEPANTTSKITGEQQEDMRDPREENEAFRKQTEEALDIDLDDPDVNAAAAKIQAGFRGHMTRKKMKSGDKDVKHKEGKEGSSTQGEHGGD